MESFSSNTAQNSSLDELDFAVLRQLQRDGRMSFTVMAERLGVSISTIRTRVGKLIGDRTIQIVGRVDPERVGFHAYAHLKIAVRPAMFVNQVAGQLQSLREVSFLAMTSGDFDLEVEVICRDNHHLLEIINERIARIEGVYQTKTDVYFKVLKYAQPDLDLLHG